MPASCPNCHGRGTLLTEATVQITEDVLRWIGDDAYSNMAGVLLNDTDEDFANAAMPQLRSMLRDAINEALIGRKFSVSLDPVPGGATTD